MIGIIHPDDMREIAPKPDLVLSSHDELILVGPDEAIQKIWAMVRQPVVDGHRGPNP